MASDRDFYEILGVSRNATQEQIQRAYRKLARAHHPDVNKDPGAEDRFKDVSEAYNVLHDPETRRRYDAFGPDFRRVPDDVDPETWNRAATGGGPWAGGAGTGGRARRGAADTGFATGFGEDIDLDDLLGGLFGGRAGRGWGPIPGADQEAVIDLTVEEAYRGTRRSVTLEGGGQTRTLQVTIPAGVTNGQRIRLAGQGGRGTEGAPAGDLYLIVRIAPHPRYRVEGRDLHVELPLAPWEAALGTTVAVETPDGADHDRDVASPDLRAADHVPANRQRSVRTASLGDRPFGSVNMSDSSTTTCSAYPPGAPRTGRSRASHPRAG